MASHVAEARRKAVLPQRFGGIPVFPHRKNAREETLGASLTATPVWPIQAKLKMGAVDDPLEREADQIAERVTGTARFDRSFAEVRVHSNDRAAASARAMNAFAATVGQQIASGDKGDSLRREGGGAEIGQVPEVVQSVLSSPGLPLGTETRRRLEPRFGHSFADVRIHSDDRAAASARAMNAFAYTVGQHIAFASGSFAPSTFEGESLLAHELAHTVQQGGGGRIAVGGPGNGAAGQTVRCRRVPDAGGAAAILPAGGTDLAAHEKGLVRLLRSAWSELSPANQMKVRTDAATFGIAGPTEATLFAALAAGTREQVLKFAEAVRTADPTVQLGDPALIDTGPRALTADAANLNKLVAGANKIFDAVASGARDSDVGDIFGPANVAKAKAKYAKGRTAMNGLHAAKKIVTDRSGYSGEVSLGGLSNASQIAISPDVVDNPTVADSIMTLVHESMHAGNGDVGDLGYLGSASFTEMQEAEKLDNAADYEVVGNRILTPAAASAFPGKKFVPAGATVGGVKAPPLTVKQRAIREASETIRRAWTTGLNLHTLFVRELKHPTEWNTLDLGPVYGVAGGTHFSDALPYWSKVENMTIHQRPGINAAGGSPATNPVTLIDVAQSEGVIRKLAQGMDEAKLTEPEAVTLELKASAAQQAQIAKGPADETKVLISLVRSEKLGEITGPVERDERAVDRLSKASLAPSFFNDVLSPKSPSTFKD